MSYNQSYALTDADYNIIADIVRQHTRSNGKRTITQAMATQQYLATRQEMLKNTGSLSCRLMRSE